MEEVLDENQNNENLISECKYMATAIATFIGAGNELEIPLCGTELSSLGSVYIEIVEDEGEMSLFITAADTIPNEDLLYGEIGLSYRYIDEGITGAAEVFAVSDETGTKLDIFRDGIRDAYLDELTTKIFSNMKFSGYWVHLTLAVRYIEETTKITK